MLAPDGNVVAASAPTRSDTAGNWAVKKGALTFTVSQMGADITGKSAGLTDVIRFDETAVDGKHGSVKVTIERQA